MTKNLGSETFPARDLAISNVWTGKGHMPVAVHIWTKEEESPSSITIILRSNPGES